jgi:pSer/pThr/pTyr-binding forkhead associated (FHA) protein
MPDDRPDLVPPTVSREVTVGRAASARFRRERPALRWVGVLTPIAGLATATLRLDQDETIVGREKDPGSPGYDESVSRRHARITRRGDEFVLEDLGSFNGTHVEGVPVLSCVLFDGDTVQFGQTLYHFGRILETARPAREGQP